MNNKHKLWSHAGTPIEKLPQDVRTQVEADPKLLEEFQAQARISSLLKLKSYEQPDPAMEGRAIHRVGIRILNGEHLRKQSTLDAMPDWARMVAVVVVMLSLSVITHREMLSNQEIDADTGLASEEMQTFSETSAEPLVPLYASDDPFAPTFINVDTNKFPNLMTPEFSRQLESSFLELGLGITNSQDDVNFVPVSFAPLP